MDDLFDLSLLAAYESLGQPPVASAWMDLYKTAVLKAGSRGLKARLQPEAALADAISTVVDHATAAMPPAVADRVSAVAIAQVQYLAARHHVTHGPTQKSRRDKKHQGPAAEALPRSPAELHPLGADLYDLVLKASNEQTTPMGPKELARILGEHPADVERAVEILATMGWLKKGFWGVKPGKLVWRR